MEQPNEQPNNETVDVEETALEAQPSSSSQRRRVVALKQFQQNFLTGLTHRDSVTAIARPSVDVPSYVEPTLGEYGHIVWDHQTNDDENLNLHIFIGSCESVTRLSYDDLARESIGGIVNSSKIIPCHHRDQGMKYCMVAINDVIAADLLTYLPGATAFIRACLTKFNKSVLVHCMAGVSRSASIVIAYLIRYENMTLEEAYQHVKQKRPQIEPNDGFWAQLANYEAQCQHKRRQEEERQRSNVQQDTSLVEDNTANELDKDWAKRSTALYGACRDMELSDDSFLEGCFAKVKDYMVQQQLQVSQDDLRLSILNVALDYIWGRGVLPVEADWLAQLCQILDQQQEKLIVKESTAISHTVMNQSKQTSASLIDMILQDPESDFCSVWAGEIYTHQLEIVYNALGIQSNK